MKNILLGFLGLLLFSCNQETASKDKEVSENLNNISFTDNLQILGNWTMCSSSGNGMMTEFNVCPTISFLANGSGLVGNSAITTDRFSWKFKKGKLNILPNDKGSNATFSDTFYFARITMEKDLRSLIISATKNDGQYYLSK